MKERIIIGLFICMFLLTGCVKKEDQEKIMLEASIDYYEKYMVGIDGIDTAIVTIEMLRKENEYDLKVLDKCKDDSKVTFEIIDGKIEDKKIELNCK